jgi:hypothetical protein
MTFDSKEELWLANNASSSDLIIRYKQEGWKYVYGTSAKNNNSDINALLRFNYF